MKKSRSINKNSRSGGWILSIALILLLGCTKDAGTPDESEEFYVRCILNGETWESCCEDPACGIWGNEKELRLDFYDSNKHLEFVFRRHCNNEDQVHGLHADSIVIGHSSKIRRIEFSDRKRQNGCWTFKRNEDTKNHLFIKEIDYQKKLMTGLFEYDVFNECGDTVRVEDGQFRVKFRFFP